SLAHALAVSAKSGELRRLHSGASVSLRDRNGRVLTAGEPLRSTADLWAAYRRVGRQGSAETHANGGADLPRSSARPPARGTSTRPAPAPRAAALAPPGTIASSRQPFRTAFNARRHPGGSHS